MPSEFPPRLSQNAKITLAVVLLLTLAYSVVIASQILLWFVIVGLAAGVYITWALVVAVYRMAEAVERLADAMEARTPRETSPAVGGANVADGTEDADNAEETGAPHVDDAGADADDG